MGYVLLFILIMESIFPILTLSVGELLSERVSCDDQHPLDSPEKNHIIALQLEIHAGAPLSFSHADFEYKT